MGETAMGWSDCADPCNDNNYGTIARYVGPQQLDGQFDFVLYHAAAHLTFAWQDRGMLHADYWTKHGLARWPAGSVMTPYVGSHDTPRFLSHADYRGDNGRPRNIPGNQWFDTATAPLDAEPYRRQRIAFAWLLGAIPGAPLLYMGDEYGQWGGADPNNRIMWRTPANLNGDESATLAFIRKLGQARRDVPALRRGGYQTLGATEDTLVVGRKISNGNAAVVGVTRAGSNVVTSVPVQAELGFAPGTTLVDELGGPSATVAGNGTVSITIPAGGAVILRP
jgi:glycosidase